MESNRVVNFLTFIILVLVPVKSVYQGISSYFTPLVSVVIHTDGSYTIDYLELLPFILLLASLLIGLVVKVEKSLTLQYYSRALLVLVISYIIIWLYLVSLGNVDNIIHDIFSWNHFFDADIKVNLLSLNLIAVIYIVRIFLAMFYKNVK